MYHYKQLSMRRVFYVLDNCKYCRLGISENDQAYILPMFFTYDQEWHRLVFTLMSQGCGQKIRFLQSNRKVTLEFELQNRNGIESVIAYGYADTMKPHIDDYRNCGPDGAVIKVAVSSISGRFYDTFGSNMN